MNRTTFRSVCLTAGLIGLAAAVSVPRVAADPPRPLAQRLRAMRADRPATGRNSTPAKSSVNDRNSRNNTEKPRDSLVIAAEVDRLIAEGSKEAAAKAAGRSMDEDFLRRVTIDLAGTLPSPRDVTLFGLDSDPNKRFKQIDRLLASDDFSQNWARYWRDVVFSRATDMRAQLGSQSFEDWLREKLKKNEPWDQTVTSILTATGDVRENGSTGLIFAHGGEPAEIAAEASRVFLGIQIQCANCHDHPTDSWKREQFHQLAAFFPRIRLQPKLNSTPRSFEVVSLDSTPGGRMGVDPFSMFRENPELVIRRNDRNNDNKISKKEAEDEPLGRLFDRLIQLGDSNKDGMLSADELKKIQPPEMAGRGAREYFMPDLDNPSARGMKIDPVFFVGEQSPGADLDDADRRAAVARYIASAENPWFARAFVNRIWTEMLGEGFYMPVDDLGPERAPRHEQALDLLCDGFVSNKFDVRWMFKTIALTETYQRQIRVRETTENPTPFIAAIPARLRADQIYSSITRVLGIEEIGGGGRPIPGERRLPRGPRDQFSQLFGFDPSTPQDEIAGSVPQALFLMNSPQLNRLMAATGNTTLSRILSQNSDNRNASMELYLLVLAREPSERELKVCDDYIKEVGNRSEAFEDLLWSLMNSSEFLSKR